MKLTANREKIIGYLRAMYGEDRETVTTGEIVAMAKKYKIPNPQWLPRVSRGVFSMRVAGTNKKVVKLVKEEPAVAEIATPAQVDKISVDTEELYNIKNYMHPAQPDYVSWGHAADIRTIIESGIFCPTYVTGPTGNGKTTMLMEEITRAGRGFVRVNLNKENDEDDLLGAKTLEDGNVVFVDGPVTIAATLGIPLILDEIDASDPNRILCLMPILEGRPIYIKRGNKIVRPAKGFNIFATANTKGRGDVTGLHIGTINQNEAFLERFAATFEQPYPDEKTERKIIFLKMKKYGYTDKEFAANLLKWVHIIRATYEEGGIDSLITTRRVEQICQLFAIFKDQKKAITYAINRFDDLVKSAMLDLWEKMVPNDPNAPTHESEDIPF